MSHLSFCMRLSDLTIPAQFDRYRILQQQGEPGSSTGTATNTTPRAETQPSLFGDDQLTQAQMIWAARDTQKELNPHAELKFYLDEPLYEGNLSPMGWWKVSLHSCPGDIGNKFWIGQCCMLTSPCSNCTRLSPCSGILCSLWEGFLECWPGWQQMLWKDFTWYIWYPTIHQGSLQRYPPSRNCFTESEGREYLGYMDDDPCCLKIHFSIYRIFLRFRFEPGLNANLTWTHLNLTWI